MAFRGLSPSPLFYTCDKCDKWDKSKPHGVEGGKMPIDRHPAIGHGARTTNEGGIEMGVVDWSKPIEAVNPDGKVVPTHVLEGPDHEGDYWVKDVTGKFTTSNMLCVTANGISDTDGWIIRNVAAVSGEAINELATLRAFRERALARYPDLAEPESDSDAAYRLTKAYEAQPHGTPYDLARDAIAWARANPR